LKRKILQKTKFLSKSTIIFFVAWCIIPMTICEMRKMKQSTRSGPLKSKKKKSSFMTTTSTATVLAPSKLLAPSNPSRVVESKKASSVRESKKTLAPSNPSRVAESKKPLLAPSNQSVAEKNVVVDYDDVLRLLVAEYFATNKRDVNEESFQVFEKALSRLRQTST
jgi:hypothetical protein